LFLADQFGKSGAHVAFEVANKALTTITIVQLTQQAVGIGNSTNLTEGSTFSFDKLTHIAELDVELAKNRETLKERNQCAKQHIVKWELTIYNSDNGASTLRNTYALNKETGTYYFDEKSVKNKSPVRARYLYPISLRCSNTTFCTCASVYLSEEGKTFDELTNGRKLCDFGYSVKLRLFLTTYLYSYGNSNIKPVKTTVNQESGIWATFSCKKLQPHP
jgi:hypothetical protein